MTAAVRVDQMLGNALDGLANALDKVASKVCDLDARDRERALSRLRRISADVGALLSELERAAAQRGEPAETH